MEKVEGCDNELEMVEGGDNQLEKVEGGDDEFSAKVDGDTEIVHAEVGDTSVSVVLSKVRMWTKYLYYSNFVNFMDTRMQSYCILVF